MPSRQANLPKLLYLGDVPVEASQHGSALLYRLLTEYPPSSLRIIESNLALSKQIRRLPHVDYRELPTGRVRLLNSRLHGPYSALLTWTASSRVKKARSLIGDFLPEAIISVGHGYGWLTAAKLAKDLEVPFHLIMHDDWPRLAGIPSGLRDWFERLFALVYNGATNRLCVSPFMAEEYARRYGAAGSVLYPSRAAECPIFEAKTARALQDEDELVIGYGGNGATDVVSCIRTLATVLKEAKARLVVFGPFHESIQRELHAISPAITFHGMVPYHEMIAGLRAQADVLLIPMSFEAAAHDNMVVSFPSKLTDYTATGLPLMIYAPPYSSAVRWAQLYVGVAEVIDQGGPAPLLRSLHKLRNNPECRRILGERASVVGFECFDASAAREQLYSALDSDFQGSPQDDARILSQS
jgi:glycosyltransferase involved in cell wall biosynthesis